MQVKNFMTKFRQTTYNSPVDGISLEELSLRLRLTHEETKEFENSFDYNPETGLCEVDKADVLDSLCDRLYVLLGDAHAVGLAYLLPVGFRIVHESNMSKLWTAREVAALPARHPMSVELISPGTNRPYLVLNVFGKVMKSPSYSPANLKDLFDELEGQEVMDFETVVKMVFGEEPEPDIDEPVESVPF